MNTLTFSTLLRHCSLLLVSLFVTLNVTSAQDTAAGETGKLSGTILDAETGEAIIGANIRVMETSRGAATDINGKFSISNLEPGIYAVRISYISYATKNITGIEIVAGEVTTLNTSLQTATQTMDEITVTATVNRNSEAGLLSMQRQSVPMQDGISSEQISKLGDSDVGSAIKRVTGVTVRNGKDVFVRGLGNRYANVQLNGSQLPSTSPNKKEAPVDLFGSGLVDNIVVQKTYTADQLAEFSGGSVQITTREFPDERNLTIGYSTSYNSVSTFDETWTSAGSGTDFLGYDNGKRDLPSILRNQRLNESISSQVVSGLHNDWNLTRRKEAIPSQSISIDYANQFNEDRMPIGVVSNFSYQYARELQPNSTQRFVQFFNSNGPNFLTDYDHDKGVIQADLSGMLNLFVKPSNVTKIGLKTLYSNSTTDTKSLIQGAYQNGVNRLTVLDFDKRTIFSGSLEGETYFENFLASTLTAKVSYNRAERVQPDRRTTRYTRSGGVFSFEDFGQNNGHFFADQEDNNYSAELKYEFKPVPLVNVSMGGNAIIKDRRFTARRIAYLDVVAPFVPDTLASRSPAEVLDDSNIASGMLELTESTNFGRNRSDWYDGYQTIYAGFVSTKWNLADYISLEVGGRVEESTQTIDVPLSIDGEYVEVSEVSNTDFLPAVNATVELTEKSNLRAAFSQTLARPEFREISNFDFADFQGGQRVYGNPGLERTRITNYDLRFETYPSGGELFAVSAFYKHFEKPIELFYRLTEANEVFYDNAPEADLYGVELEARKNLTERLQVVANGSYIVSETRMNADAANRVANLERPMVGQSPYTVNFSTFYALPRWNMDFSMSYNTFGERIVTVGKNGQQDDEYEKPFHDLGAKVDYYGFGQLDLSLEVSNLLNDDRLYQQNGVTTFKYSPGVTFTLGAKLSL